MWANEGLWFFLSCVFDSDWLGMDANMLSSKDSFCEKFSSIFTCFGP